VLEFTQTARNLAKRTNLLLPLQQSRAQMDHKSLPPQISDKDPQIGEKSSNYKISDSHAGHLLNLKVVVPDSQTPKASWECKPPGGGGTRNRDVADCAKLSF